MLSFSASPYHSGRSWRYLRLTDEKLRHRRDDPLKITKPSGPTGSRVDSSRSSTLEEEKHHPRVSAFCHRTCRVIRRNRGTQWNGTCVWVKLYIFQVSAEGADYLPRDSLVVPEAKTAAPNTGSPDSTLDQGTTSHMPTLKICMPQLRPCTAK